MTHPVCSGPRNQYLLEHGRDNMDMINDYDNTIIIPPVNIHPNARVSQSLLGPHVSLGDGAVIQGSIIKNSIIGEGTHITNSMLETSIIGHNVTVSGQTGKLNLGDNSWAVK